jgi:hypothetical protein
MNKSRFRRLLATHLLTFIAGVLLMAALDARWNRELRAGMSVLKQKNNQLQLDLDWAVARGLKVETELNLCRQAGKDTQQ